jgi:inner membrane protein
VTLGAAVGEAVLGKKLGNRAALWGAVCGTLPDLDVISGLFLDDMQQLALHRGLSHSIFFAVIGGWGAGHLLARLHPDATARQWGLLAFLAFATHSLLDCFTVYGTQVFQPFSDYPVAWGTLFIIDPLYTLPLMVPLLVVLFLRRDAVWRRRLNGAGLVLSTLYVLVAVFNQQRIEAVFSRSLEGQGLGEARLMSTPTPFNTVLWMGIADDGHNLRVGLRSLLDEGEAVAWHTVDKRSELLETLQDQAAIERLMWFSRGYYVAGRRNGALYIHDARFGSSDAWLGHGGEYIFNFRIVFDSQDPSRTTGFVQEQPQVDIEAEVFRRLWLRLLGQRQ